MGLGIFTFNRPRNAKTAVVQAAQACFFLTLEAPSSASSAAKSSSWTLRVGPPLERSRVPAAASAFGLGSESPGDSLPCHRVPDVDTPAGRSKRASSNPPESMTCLPTSSGARPHRSPPGTVDSPEIDLPALQRSQDPSRRHSGTRTGRNALPQPRWVATTS